MKVKKERKDCKVKIKDNLLKKFSASFPRSGCGVAVIWGLHDLLPITHFPEGGSKHSTMFFCGKWTDREK